jgi:hypothetical protein
MLRLAFPVTLRQELFILSSGHHLRRTPRLPTIKLFSKLLRSLTARPVMQPPERSLKIANSPARASARATIVALSPRKATGRGLLEPIFAIYHI